MAEKTATARTVGGGGDTQDTTRPIIAAMERGERLMESVSVTELCDSLRGVFVLCIVSLRYSVTTTAFATMP